MNPVQQQEGYDKEKQYQRHPYAHKNGGYHMNLTEDTKLMSIISPILKQVGQKISRGDFNLATLVKPVQMTHPMTMLEALSNDFTYSHFLNLAAQCKDPLQRMQNVVLGTISAVHVNQSVLHSKAPIDCCIGETLQYVKSDGTEFFAEFINSNPPTSLMQLFGPNNDFYLWAVDEVFAEIHPTFTQIIGRTMRKRKLKFKDGKIFDILMPTMIIEGVLNGDRILNFMDECIITSPSDNLTARIVFSYQYQGKVSKLTGKIKNLFWGQTKNNNKPLNDLVDIQIYKTVEMDDEEQQFTLCMGSGSWLSYLQLDGQVLWRFNDSFLPWLSPKNKLPSDSMFRVDRTLILEDKLDQAQKQFLSLQNVYQRVRLQIEEEENLLKQLRKTQK